MYDALPPESRTARCQLLVPARPAPNLGAAVHLAATGDQGFGRRLRLAFPLLKQVGLHVLGVSCGLKRGCWLAQSCSWNVFLGGPWLLRMTIPCAFSQNLYMHMRLASARYC